MTELKKTKKGIKTQKGDFVEIDFTAKIKDGEVFDTTIELEAKKAGLLREGDKRKFEPFKLCIGKEMILHALDSSLADKELGKGYEIELKPEEAFGKRNPKLVKIISLGTFLKKGMSPEPGTFVNVNDMLAKIISISGGRVVVDFNNPLADKNIVYKVKINKIMEDEKEKIDSVASFYFRDYEIKETKAESKKETEEGTEKNKFELVVKGDKVEEIDKAIKELFPELEIKYS